MNDGLFQRESSENSTKSVTKFPVLKDFLNRFMEWYIRKSWDLGAAMN